MRTQLAKQTPAVSSFEIFCEVLCSNFRPPFTPRVSGGYQLHCKCQRLLLTRCGVNQVLIYQHTSRYSVKRSLDGNNVTVTNMLCVNVFMLMLCWCVKNGKDIAFNIVTLTPVFMGADKITYFLSLRVNTMVLDHFVLITLQCQIRVT